MNLDVLLEPIPSRNAPQPCLVARILNDLQEPYRGALERLLNTTYRDGGLSDEQLALKMRDAGLEAGQTAIHKHRKGKCICK